jgi:hypothetical protein
VTALSTHSHRAWRGCVLQEKDVKRTFPHYHFFNGEVERKKHYNAIKRILFIYAKLNPGIGYVQGACVCHPSHVPCRCPLLTLSFARRDERNFGSIVLHHDYRLRSRVEGYFFFFIVIIIIIIILPRVQPVD